MPAVYPLFYGPNLDQNWSVNPGVCYDMSYLCPTQDGALASVRVDNTNGTAFGFSVTGGDHLHAEVFSQTSGSARFLTFRVQNIDEYSATGVRTNQGTGYSASTADWSVTAYGNQIIAVNYLNAPQSSTGTTFSGLSGSPPKARYIASNVNFVIMGDVDDSGSNVYTDMVWWCGIRNPNTWTPSQATQAGRIRLLDAPGPIRGIAALGDKFVAFKDNALFLGQYIGPPYVFSWKLISDTIGLFNPKCFAVCDGKLYFMHISGLYSFDGVNLRNVGLACMPPVDAYQQGQKMYMRGDDLTGTIFVGSHTQTVSSFTSYGLYAYAYNVRSGIWSRIGSVCSSSTAANNSPPVIVYGSASEYYAYKSAWGVTSGFGWIDNAASPKLSFLTGAAVAGTGSSLDNAATITTGKVGTNDTAGGTVRVYPRMIKTSTTSSPVSSATLNYFQDEMTGSSAVKSATLTYNSELQTLDGVAAGRYKNVVLTWNTSKTLVMAGIGFSDFPGGRR